MLQSIHSSKRIVIKLGSQIVVEENGTFSRERLADLVRQCVDLYHQDKEILIVTSGAVGLGRRALQLMDKPLSLCEKQACAAVGQSLLMNAYRELFGRYQFETAQLLLTSLDFADRRRYLNLRETLAKLLELQVIPIINENDTVSTIELEEDRAASFGDNDKLSALVASKLDADLLVLLTNVDGIYTDNPAQNPDAVKIPLVESFEQLGTIVTQGKSIHGRGGMASKIEAAKIAAMSGVHTVIHSGLRPQALTEIFEGDTFCGTVVLGKTKIPGRKRWLGLASGYSGIVFVNEGAKHALIERQASLLPSGIVDIEGDFQPRQIVSIHDPQGAEIGRGVINFSAQDTRKIKGCHTQDIARLLGADHADEVIHRDNLVIYQDYAL